MHNRIVDAVFDEWLIIGRRKKLFVVCLIVGEQQVGCFLQRTGEVDPALTKLRVVNHGRRVVDSRQHRRFFTLVPAPGITKPHLWEHVDLRRIRASVRHRDLADNFFRVGLGILHDNIEIPVLAPLTFQRVEELVLPHVLAASKICCQQILVRERCLRILVDH